MPAVTRAALLHPKHPERICWGCDKYCPADDLACGNGRFAGRTPVSSSELTGWITSDGPAATVLGRRVAMSLWPKEHGAYGQLVFTIAAALGVAGPSLGGLLLVATTVAAFVAHEPAAVLLGWRGSRARRERGRQAVLWLWCAGAIAAVAAVGALIAMPRGTLATLLVPLPPLAVLVAAAARGREKTATGEVAAATAFSLAVVPIAVASGLSLRSAFAIAVPFLALFIASTLAVRVVILRVRGGGAHARVAVLTRVAAALFIGAATAGLLLAYALEVWPPATVVASLPGLTLSAVLVARPPSPSHLRTVGWKLVDASLVTTAIVVGH